MEKKTKEFMTKRVTVRLQEYQDKLFKDFIEKQYKPLVKKL